MKDDFVKEIGVWLIEDVSREVTAVQMLYLTSGEYSHTDIV